jgi:hypothetical protein
MIERNESPALVHRELTKGQQLEQALVPQHCATQLSLMMNRSLGFEWLMASQLKTGVSWILLSRLLRSIKQL